MVNKKFSELTELAITPASTDLVCLVDVSDTTESVTGTNKKIQYSNLIPSSQLSDLTDVNTSTATNRFVLVADGVDFESRLLTALDVSDFDTEVSNNSAVALNTAKVTNATHTGDVTGDTALTIAVDAVNDTHIDFGTGANQVSTLDIPEETNLYYTEVRVSANTDVTANTAKVGVTTEISDIVEDTTPQLGGDLDLNNKSLTRIETAGESLVAGDVCYLKTDGKYWKADASAEATCDTDLLLSNAIISADATGEFIEYGEYTTTGLTAGSKYYISETTGAYTATAPSTSLSIVRIIGTAESTTILKFKPDQSYVEIA